MHTSEDSIRLLLNPFICLGMTHFPSCAAITLPTCQSSTCSTLLDVCLSYNHLLPSTIHPEERKKTGAVSFFQMSSSGLSNCFLVRGSDYRTICKTRQILQWEGDTQDVFFHLAHLSCMEQKQRGVSRTRF